MNNNADDASFHMTASEYADERNRDLIAKSRPIYKAPHNFYLNRLNKHYEREMAAREKQRQAIAAAANNRNNTQNGARGQQPQYGSWSQPPPLQQSSALTNAYNNSWFGGSKSQPPPQRADAPPYYYNLPRAKYNEQNTENIIEKIVPVKGKKNKIIFICVCLAIVIATIIGIIYFATRKSTTSSPTSSPTTLPTVSPTLSPTADPTQKPKQPPTKGKPAVPPPGPPSDLCTLTNLGLIEKTFETSPDSDGQTYSFTQPTEDTLKWVLNEDEKGELFNGDFIAPNGQNPMPQGDDVACQGSVYKIDHADDPVGVITVLYKLKPGAVQSVAFDGHGTGALRGAPPKLVPQQEAQRRRVLGSVASNAYSHLFSYTSMSALLIVAVSVCLQSAYLYYR